MPLPSPFAFNLSRIKVFSNKSALCIGWPKHWSFSFSIRLSNECLGLISFRIDWFDLLAVQGTLKSLLQHHSSKTLILWCLAFFMVQLSHLYMTTGKIIALTTWTKWCLCFLIHYLGLSLMSPSAVMVLAAQENEFCHCFNLFLFYLSLSDGMRCQDLSFVFF